MVYDQVVGYPEGTAFPGTISRTVAGSRPAWPLGPRPPAGAPNVVIVVLDDLGFGELGCFGGRIDTPHLDRLAAGGLRYTNFHVNPMCSPTRAALLTGRNHHAVGVGLIMEWLSGFPGYHGRIPKEAAMLPAVLTQAGYSSMAVGKWHLTPVDEVTPIGPFDRWPLGQGFQRYYGFMTAQTDQLQPTLWVDNHRIDPPLPPGYHLSEDLVDQSVAWIDEQQAVAPTRPFFLYLAFGAMHQPHQVAHEWWHPYRGRFADGWDVIRAQTLASQQRLGLVPAHTTLPARNPGVRAWAQLNSDEQRVCERQMEVYAGMLTHTDHQIGRLVAELERRGIFKDTVILVLSDNGASAEGGTLGHRSGVAAKNGATDSLANMLAALDQWGGPATSPHYASGWAMAGNTPNRWYKRFTHEGGTRAPLIVHAPQWIDDPGGVRSQFHHVVDVMPTVLELAHIQMPDIVNGHHQRPLEGVDFAYTLTDPTAPTRKQSQYFEMLGHRAIWADGWKAVATHWATPMLRDLEAGEYAVHDGDPDADRWELYHLDEDVSESRDVADEHPDTLRRLRDLWWSEADRHQVLPLNDRWARGGHPAGIVEQRSNYTFYGPLRLTHCASPNLRNRSHVLTATVNIPPDGAEGVLVAHGGARGRLCAMHSRWERPLR